MASTVVPARLPRRNAAVADSGIELILRLRPRGLWRFFVKQDIAYMAICVYLLLEYVRPQLWFPALSTKPVATVTLASAILAQLLRGRGFSVKGAGSWLLFLFTAVILMSSFAAWDFATAREGWKLWFSWVLIYFLIVSVLTTEARLAFFLLLWLVFNFYMAQGAAKQFALRGFSFTQWGVVGAPGWFENSGEFGVAMCLFVPIAWRFYVAAKPHLNRWGKLFLLAMPVSALVGLVGSASRGSQLGMGAVLLWSFLQSKRKLRTIAAVSAIGVAFWLLLPAEQKQRFSEAGDDYTSWQRKIYWRNGLDMAAHHPVLGIGYNNWVPYHRWYYTRTSVMRHQIAEADAETNDRMNRTQLPHNIFIQCVAELGYGGLLVYVSMMVATLWINAQTRRLARAGPGPSVGFQTQIAYGLDSAMIGFIASGYFVSVLYYPFFWINLALTASLNASARRGSHVERTAMRVTSGGGFLRAVGPARRQ